MVPQNKVTSGGDSVEPQLQTRLRPSFTFNKSPAADETDDPLDVLEHAPPVLARKRRRPVKKEDLDELILVWPRGEPGALNISLGDLRRLKPGEFLNDTIVEFGLKYWLHNLRIAHNPIADDIHVFSSFFYKQLNQKNFEKGYQSVRKWTNKVDIFQKKYIVLPINEHIHWYLAIIYRPEYVLHVSRPKQADAVHANPVANDSIKMSYIFTFDSLGGRHPEVINNLQKYLAAEAADKRNLSHGQISVPRGKRAIVPTQPNYCDCGLYLLHFAERFIDDPEKFTRAILTPARKLSDNERALWQTRELADKRSQLEAAIMTHSAEWKREQEDRARPKRQALDNAHDDFDDDYIICQDHVLVTKKFFASGGTADSRR